MNLTFNASPTLGRFMDCEDFVRGVIGPFGSGKSSACCVEIVKRAYMQEPDHDGVRRTRWVVIRNTYRQLEDTSIKTFKSWFPVSDEGEPLWGSWKQAAKTYHLGAVVMGDDVKDYLLPGAPDKNGNPTWVYAEVMFRALDRPDDVDNLLSLELTGGWINEFREVPYDVLESLSGRVGRFPSKSKGPGASWNGIILDSNPPDMQSSYYRAFKEQVADEVDELAASFDLDPVKFSLFEQPSGLSPEAENLEHLPGGRLYYVKMLAAAKRKGRSQSWIDVHIHGKWGYLQDGKGVYNEHFNDSLHVSQKDIKHDSSLPLLIGLDPGHSSGAVYAQRDRLGRWVILGEFIGEDIGAVDFCKALGGDVRARFGLSARQVAIYADPAIKIRSQVDMRSVADVFRGHGFRVYESEMAPQIRIDSVRAALSRNISGSSGFVLNKDCHKLVRGFLGGYHFRRMNVSGEKYTEKPDKNEYSHIHDALQYVIAYFEAPTLRGGKPRPMPNLANRTTESIKPRIMDNNWSPYGA
jgi:hypothetical protein